jgi:hypothetical protein
VRVEAKLVCFLPLKKYRQGCVFKSGHKDNWTFVN